MQIFIRKYIFKLIGILFILFAGVIALFNRCPTNAQYFIIYAFIGIGLALVFARSAEKTKVNLTIYNLSIGLIGSVAIPFILFFTNPIGSFKPDDCNSKLKAVNITIFVHGKKGKQDIVLRQKGSVIMDVGGERKKEPINDKGQAFFQNLQVDDSVRINVDFSEPYTTINPDSIYTIPSNGRIYLAVALQGIDKVKGMALFRDAPLQDVIVKLISPKGNLIDTTNQLGDFEFIIPEQIQANEYNVWFMKKGFKTKSVPAFPQTGEALNILMDKE